MLALVPVAQAKANGRPIGRFDADGLAPVAGLPLTIHTLFFAIHTFPESQSSAIPMVVPLPQVGP